MTCPGTAANHTYMYMGTVYHCVLREANIFMGIIDEAERLLDEERDRKRQRNDGTSNAAALAGMSNTNHNSEVEKSLHSDHFVMCMIYQTWKLMPKGALMNLYYHEHALYQVLMDKICMRYLQCSSCADQVISCVPCQI